MSANLLERMRRTTHKPPHLGRKVFYVCSFGGCGSKMLCEYLRKFGTVKHVHSRNPPTRLTHISTNEWFTSVPVNEKDLPNYYVIYIYRNPIKAILSRFSQSEHLAHIQTNPTITLNQVLSERKDLYGIENFFDNYTQQAPNKRNYKIYCVKYEDLFQKMTEFNRIFNITCSPGNYPQERTRDKPFTNDIVILYQLYANLIERMKNMPFIQIV